MTTYHPLQEASLRQLYSQNAGINKDIKYKILNSEVIG